MLSAATIGTIVAMAYPIVDAMIHERNAKKAANLRAQLNTLLAANNVKINDLRAGLEQKGIRYNVLMNAIDNTSPAGKAWQMKKQADKEYVDSLRQANTQINQLTKASELLSSQANKDIEKLESKGILRTITGDLIE